MRSSKKKMKSNESAGLKIEIKKQKALDILEQEPDNLEAIKDMIKISRKEGNTDAEREYLYRRLEVETNNAKVTIMLIRIAKANNDFDEVKALKDKIANMELTNVSQMKGALAMAAEDKDEELKEMLGNKLNRAIKIRKEAAKGEIKEADVQVRQLKRKMLGREETQTFVEMARTIIYENEDVEKRGEKIKALLEGQDSTEVALILAELYFHTGMRERAEKSLKAYRKTLEGGAKASDIALVNQAIEITRNTKALPYKWEEFWRAREQKHKTPLGEKKQLTEEER